MRRLLFLTPLLMLGACSTLSNVPTSPGQAADRTTIDEKAGIGATAVYIGASRLGTALARSGAINQPAFKALDDKGYALVLAIRAAYDAGNASDYLTALARLDTVIAQMHSLGVPQQ